MRRAATARPGPAAALCAAALALAGCSKPRLRPLLAPDQRIDTFPQVARAQLDALFVVDNADHIRPHQQKVADSFHRFLDYLDKNQIDYHVGIVTTDLANAPGVYQGGGKGYFAAGDDNLADNLTRTIVSLGEHGSPIEAALLQLDRSLHGPPAGFLRDSASLFLVAVTDDDDPWSPGEDLYYYRSFKAAKGPGNDGVVTFSAIAGDVPGGCRIPNAQNPAESFFADPAVRLQGLAKQTGGVFHSLCDPSFDQVFDELGATAAGLRRAFRLASTPDPTSLAVDVRVPCGAPESAFAACTDRADECGGQEPAIVCTVRAAAQDGWRYDPATNSVFFSGAAVPARGALVEVTYKEQAK